MGEFVGQISASPDGVGGAYLSSGWASLTAKADTAFQEAMSIAKSWYDSTPITINAPGAPTIDTSLGTISTAGQPTDPEIPSLDLSFPTMPELTGASYTPGVAPTFTATTPAIQYPTAPTPAMPTAPNDAPIVSSVTLPNDPVVTLPDVPTLLSIELPAAPTLILPTFAGVSPSTGIPELPNVDFLWDEPEYTAHLSEFAAKIAGLLAYDYAAAETAIWERGHERIERSITTAVNDLANDFASRGFSLPSGSLLAAMAEVRAKGMELKADNAREAMIKAAEANSQKLALALETGIKYEGMWLSYQGEKFKRAFEARRYAVEITVRLHEMKVALFNARLQAYQVEAQVHRDLIQAELTHLEVYRTELEAQKIIGQLNQQDVELYNAQLQGSLAAIELYKAQVSAAVATIEVDKAKLQAYATQVDAYKAHSQANAAEYAAWGEQMRGEAVKAQLYEAEVRAFASKVDAYKSTEMVGIESAKLALMHDENRLKKFTTQLAGVESEIKAYTAGLDATSKIFDNQVKSYAALIGAREAEARAKLAGQGIVLDVYKTTANIAIEEAQTKVAQLSEDIKAFVGRMQAAGGIVSQLAASALSAFNLGASASDSFQWQVSNSLNESYSASV